MVSRSDGRGKTLTVNLAIQMYRDACGKLYDRIILVSNDSDAEPALQAIREDFPSIMIGIVTPIPPPPPDMKQHRRVSASLAEYSDWVISSLSDAQLASAQLPDVVPTNKKAIRKPPHW